MSKKCRSIPLTPSVIFIITKGVTIKVETTITETSPTLNNNITGTIHNNGGAPCKMIVGIKKYFSRKPDKPEMIPIIEPINTAITKAINDR